MLTLGIRRAALAEEAALDPLALAPLERFCAGVNAAAASARALPFEMRLLRQREFEPWRPADVLGLGKLLAFGLATNWERELLRSDMIRALGPELAAKLDPTYPVDSPIVTQEPWSGDGLAVGRADRRGAPLDGPGHRGERLQQLGRLRQPQRRPARR